MKFAATTLILVLGQFISLSAQDLDYYRFTLKSDFPLIYKTISDDAFERCSDDAIKFENEVSIQAYCFLAIDELMTKCPDLDISTQLYQNRWDINDDLDYALVYGKIDWVAAYKAIMKDLVGDYHTPFDDRGSIGF